MAGNDPNKSIIDNDIDSYMAFVEDDVRRLRKAYPHDEPHWIRRIQLGHYVIAALQAYRDISKEVAHDER